MTIMSSQFIVYSLLAVSLTLASGAIPLLRTWKEDHLHTFVSFSAGVLMATAFLHLLPDAIKRGNPMTIGGCILASFLFLFILEKFVMIHPCEETHCDYHTMGLAAFVGMLIHTFFDGLSLGSALFVDQLGFVVFVAIMAHKIPSGFALASILKKGQWPPSRILLFIFLFGLTIPLGAIASFSFLKSVGEKGAGVALALSVGTFLYIATSDFLPEVHRQENRRLTNLASFLAGIILMVILAILLPDAPLQ